MQRFLSVLKWSALVIGLSGVVLSGMALTGLLSEMLAVRLGVSLGLAVLLPLLLARKMLPPREQGGVDLVLLTDLLALVWLALAVLFTGPALPLTRNAFEQEAARWAEAGVRPAAVVLLGIIGPDPHARAAPIGPIGQATRRNDAGHDANDAGTR